MKNSGLYNDTMRRCDLYNNPYDTRMQAHPAIVRHRAEHYAKTRDVLESSTSYLEKQIFSKIRDKNFHLPLGKFIIVVKVGKYAFIAIMLPLYIFAYALPKWLMTSGMPKLFHLIENQIKNISDKVAKVAHDGVAALKSLGKVITSPILNYIQTRMEQARELFSRLAYPFILLNQHLFQPIVRYYRAITEFQDRVLDKLRALKNKIDEMNGKVRHFLIYLPNQIEEKLTQAVSYMQVLAQKSLVPVLRWTDRQINNLGDALIQGLVRLRNRIDRTFVSPLKKAMQFARDMRDATANKLASFFNAPRDWLQRRTEGALELLDMGKDKVVETVKKFIARGKEIQRKIVEKATEGVKKIADAPQAIFHAIQQVLPLPLINFLAPVAHAIMLPHTLYRKRRLLKEKVRGFVKKIESGISRAVNWLNQKGREFGRSLKRMFVKSKKIPKIVLKKVVKAIGIFVTALQGTLLLLRLLAAWVLALIHYGMHLVRQKALLLIKE